jgi:hypothetical protein
MQDVESPTHGPSGVSEKKKKKVKKEKSVKVVIRRKC